MKPGQLHHIQVQCILAVLLGQVDLVLVGKAVDCLRILTTGNEPNKAALFGIPSALSSLVRLMDSRQPSVRSCPAAQSRQDR